MLERKTALFIGKIVKFLNKGFDGVSGLEKDITAAAFWSLITRSVWGVACPQVCITDEIWELKIA